MVKISNGTTELEVTFGAYKNFFQRLGYAILSRTGEVFTSGEETTQPDDETTQDEEISQEDEEPTDTPDEAEPEDDYDEPEEQDLSEIPLSEQDFYQLQAYADQLGLDHRGLRSKRELRALIREYLKG